MLRVRPGPRRDAAFLDTTRLFTQSGGKIAPSPQRVGMVGTQHALEDGEGVACRALGLLIASGGKQDA